MQVKISQSAHSVHAVTTTVDVPELATRYEVILTFDPVRKVYGISIPNLYKSMETSNPKKVQYKLKEKKMMAGDAEAVEHIVATILLPKLHEVGLAGESGEFYHVIHP